MKPRDQFGLDALLGRWPAQDPQEHGGPSWDQRAEKIVAAAVALKAQGSPEVIGALIDPPRLEPEPGEEKAVGFQFHDGASDRDERVLRPKPQGFDVVSPAQAASGNRSPRETERAEAGGEGAQKMSSDQGKRPSLKELAARASQAGASRPSVSSTPPPVVPATVTPIAKARAARASEPGREDSGVLRLADLQKPAATAPAAPENVEAPAAAQAPVVATTEAVRPVTAKPAAPSGGGSKAGMWAGAAIAVLGIAAAVAVYQTRKPEPARTETMAEVKPTAAPVATEAPKARAAVEPSAVASSEPAAPADEPKGDEPKGAAGAAAPTATAVAGNDVKPATPSKEAPKGGPVGTLDEEMKKAVGANDLPAAPQDDGSKPAAGGGGNVPEQPSQGNAQAAIRAVLGAAKACVAGAPEPTTASVTFSSSGAVQSVSVGGWGAANGKTGCVKSALQGARVSPFAKPTFTVPVTIRP